MRQNPARRAALLDAAVEVLARDGARGLTFRAVDGAAEVPAGTASNYFANRDELMLQICHRVYERLGASAAAVPRRPDGVRPDRTWVEALMHGIVARVADFRSGYLALLELRLEATRRPHLRPVLAERIRADVTANLDYHRAEGLPGDDDTVILLYLAMNWLIVERLTLPEVFGEERLAELVTRAVDRIVPPA
jgi:AcrR family transcriptional regulator